MAENVNPPEQVPDANPGGGGKPPKGSDDPTVAVPPVTPGSDKSLDTDKGKQPESQRRLQSERDKARESEKSTQEQLTELQEHIFGKEVQEVLTSFLSENSKKFPDVEMGDLANAESLEDEHLIASATAMQGRFDKVRNEALAKVQEVPEVTMTEEEKSEALQKLEKAKTAPGQSKFSQFINLRSAKTAKTR